MRVEVTSDTNFETGWVDSRVPNMFFNYDQASLEECEYDEGKYWATYQPLVTTEDKTFTYLLSSGPVTFTIPPGTYGLIPS
jgi:hypothetical protein